jgi:hypothetical protein
LVFDATKGLIAGVAAAALAVVASPAAAAETPRAPSYAPLSSFAPSAYDGRADVNAWGCWNCGRGGGWRRGGWGRGGGGWRRRGPSAGEVLAGVAIVGGIAAIAAASSNNRRNRTRDVVVVDRDRPPVNQRDFDRRAVTGSQRSGGIDVAVDRCLARVQRDLRVDSVEVAERTAQGWMVGGVLFDGSDFQCRIDNDGRDINVDYFGMGARSGGLSPASSAPAGNQWSASRYADARRGMAPAQPNIGTGIDWGDAPLAQADLSAQSSAPPPMARAGNAIDGDLQPLVPLTAQRLPSYPGGPVEGEELPPVVERPGIP